MFQIFWRETCQKYRVFPFLSHIRSLWTPPWIDIDPSACRNIPPIYFIFVAVGIVTEGTRKKMSWCRMGSTHKNTTQSICSDKLTQQLLFNHLTFLKIQQTTGCFCGSRPWLCRVIKDSKQLSTMGMSKTRYYFIPLEHTLSLFSKTVLTFGTHSSSGGLSFSIMLQPFLGIPWRGGCQEGRRNSSVPTPAH